MWRRRGRIGACFNGGEEAWLTWMAQEQRVERDLEAFQIRGFASRVAEFVRHGWLKRYDDYSVEAATAWMSN